MSERALSLGKIMWKASGPSPGRLSTCALTQYFDVGSSLGRSGDLVVVQVPGWVLPHSVGGACAGVIITFTVCKLCQITPCKLCQIANLRPGAGSGRPVLDKGLGDPKAMSAAASVEPERVLKRGDRRPHDATAGRERGTLVPRIEA
jgi:hypothetical protein